MPHAPILIPPLIMDKIDSLPFLLGVVVVLALCIIVMTLDLISLPYRITIIVTLLVLLGVIINRELNKEDEL